MASMRTLRTNLAILEQMYGNAIPSTAPRSPTPAVWRPGAELSLKPHQLAELHQMKQLETHLPHRWKHGEEEVTSQYAFLADPIGTGKTVTALLHIAQMKDVARYPRCILEKESTPLFYTVHEDIERPFRLYNTLIIVPHTLYLQWESQIQTYTTLKPLFLKTTRDVKDTELYTKLEKADCVLISNTLLRMFLLECQDRDPAITWRRVYYDEADTIRISPSCPQPRTYFTWFITSSPQHFLFTRNFLHSHQIQHLSREEIESYHPLIQRIVRNHLDSTTALITYYRIQSDGFFAPFIQNRHPLRFLLFVLAEDSFLQESIQYPSFTQTTIQCAPSVSAYRDELMRPEIVQLLKSGNVRSAYESLHLRPHVGAPSEQLNQHLQSDCPVCYDTLKWTLVTPCCTRPFCAECISTCLMSSVYCPLCREQIDTSQLAYIQDPFIETEATPAPRLPTKTEAFLQVLRDNPNGRFLVYAQYELPMIRLYEAVRANYPGESSRIAFLRGTKSAIASQLRNFEAGTTPFLFCTSLTSIQGLNLQCTTHIVFLHSLRDPEKSNIIRRAWRLGRTQPLSVIELQAVTAG